MGSTGSGGMRRIRRGSCLIGAAVLIGGVFAAPLKAEGPWFGRYLGLGLGTASQSVALDQLEAVVNDTPVLLGSRRVEGTLITLGYREAVGLVMPGAELELDTGRHALSPPSACVLGQSCAGAGLEGRIGPVLRLRVTLGQVIAPGVLLSAGAGLSRADVAISHAQVQAASAQDGSAVITSARSDFEVESPARGLHLSIGVEHRAPQGAALRLDYLQERFWIDTERSVFVGAATSSGTSTAVAQIAQSGGFIFDKAALRLSLVFGF